MPIATMTDGLDKMDGLDKLLVDGKLVPAAEERTFENVNPATEKVLGVAPDADVADARRAIAAARRAFDETSWSTDLALRVACLGQLEQAMLDHVETLRAIVVAEAGCPVGLTRNRETGDVPETMQKLLQVARAVQVDGVAEEFGRSVRMATGYQYEMDINETPDEVRAVVRREPRGVVTAITPFNYPAFLNARKLAPALASGNTVVLKPSPETPWSATFIGQLAAEHTDIPPGVLNVITSTKPEVAKVLTSAPEVDMVTFVGSSAVGRMITKQAGDTLKKVVLELGGKSALIALDDADPEQVATIMAGVAMHAGQGCARLTRFLVPRSRYQRTIDAAVAAFEEIAFGDPTDPTTVQGPQISARARERVLSYIERGRAQGGRCVFGGGRPSDLATGYFVEPTLFVDVDPADAIAQDEIFGPVAVVIPYETEEEAVQIANNSAYGLSSGVNSASPERALKVARKIQAGQVVVNGRRGDGDMVMGGYKHSACGYDGGLLGFEEHLEFKLVTMPSLGR